MNVDDIRRKNAQFVQALEQHRPPPPSCPRCRGRGERTTGRLWNVICTQCEYSYREHAAAISGDIKPVSYVAEACEQQAQLDRCNALLLRVKATQDCEQFDADEHAAMIAGAAALDYRADVYEKRSRKARKKRSKTDAQP